MGLLDAQKPRESKTGKYILAIVLCFAVAGALAYYFRNLPEERAVSRFLTTLERGDYQTAYHLWQPSTSYTFENFMKDWGEQGDYGKIRSFEILESKSRGATVIVTVRINNIAPPLDIIVDRRTKGLAYSPF